jgi:hypothetical protein
LIWENCGRTVSLMDVVTIQLPITDYLMLNRNLPIGSPLRRIFDEINAIQLSSPGATPVIVKVVAWTLEDAKELHLLAGDDCPEARAIIGQAIVDYEHRTHSR